MGSNGIDMLYCEKYQDWISRVLKMESSEELLSSRLLSLLRNGQWERDDVVKLFKALMKEFNGRNEDFLSWMMKNLHQVEIHKIQVTDLTFQNSDKLVDNVKDKINETAKNTNGKTLDEIVEEIEAQADIDKEMMAQVTVIVSSVNDCLTASTAPHLQGIEQSLFKLCKAVEKTQSYKPRVTQMVSWCILALSKSCRLVQVLTGEGKSCIVAMFAAYQVMMGKTPDIISSSPVLAERDSKEWFEFYKELNITVDVNTNKSTENLKKCYECQVVYGTTDSFAADWLRQHFHRQDVRPKREFQCVIVDEVDSLMLDKGLEVVYINNDMPQMEQLNGILANIWFVVNHLKYLETGEILGPVQLFSEVLSEIMHGNKSIDQLSIVQMAVDAGIMPIKTLMQKQKNLTIFLKQLDNASVVQMVTFLTMFMEEFPEYNFKLYQEGPDGNLQKLNEISSKGTNERQEVSVLLLDSGKCRIVHFEEDSLDTLLGKIIKKGLQTESTREQNESHIPGSQDLISGKIKTWFENALLATKLTLGNEYILHGDGVAPVDYSSTGVVQNDMRWGEGLQQFLEMKHQTKLSNMSLITNFMSNVGLFKKYTNQIYGITGTLGDPTELDMVKKLYNGIDTCRIPSFRQRKLYELEGMVITEEDEWIRTVCNVVKHQVSSTVYQGPRAALVICETIKRAEIFHKALSDTISKYKLKLYVNNNMDNSKIVNEALQAGDVIIATNLAGRGTDLKVSKSVNEAGGLFVLQTFLPLNVRVEQQAFGRTARQGSPGSAQIIMCSSHFSDFIKLFMSVNTSLTSLIGCPDDLTKWMSQKNLFEEAVNHYLKNHNSQNYEVMVSALADLLTKNSSNLEKAKYIRNTGVQKRLSIFLEKDIPEINKKEELFSAYLEILDDIYKKNKNSAQRDVIVSSLHECWGLWLLMNPSKEKLLEQLNEQLKVYLSSAKQKIFNKQSPSSMVYYYIRSGNNLRKNGRLTESIEMYTKALKNGVCWEIIPLYNRALATIRRKDTGYITCALDDLEKADKAIDSYKSHLAQILTCVKSPSLGDTLLTKQFQMKSMVADLLRKNIQDAVMKLKSAESRGGEVKLSEKPTLLLACDSMQRAGSRGGDGNLPEIFPFILLGDILRMALHSGGDVRMAQIFAIFLVRYSFFMYRGVMKEMLIEFEHIMSLGLDTTFSLEVTLTFSFSSFVSKLFNRF